jgi:hypothetical protein
MEEYFDRERPVVQELRRRLVELVESGRDVVLDSGLWRRSDRDADKRLVEAHGGRWRLLYLKVDPEVLRQRLADRNRRGDANALAVTPSALEDFIARFHEPVDEGEELVEAQPPANATAFGGARPPCGDAIDLGLVAPWQGVHAILVAPWQGVHAIENGALGPR